MMCFFTDRPATVGRSLGFRVFFFVAEIKSEIRHGGGLYSVYLRQSKAPWAPSKAKINGHGRSGGARYVLAGDDKIFFRDLFFKVGWRDNVSDSRGQTVDLSPQSFAVIFCALGPGLTCRRPPPHSDGDYFHSFPTMKRKKTDYVH